VTTNNFVQFGRLVGSAARLHTLREQIERAASIDLPVLIAGETGSGKELVAREIHERSDRANQPFVALNTGAMPRELIASELFGHIKGSFTGATEARQGRFVEAAHGTLFLDEIGTMEDRVQISLLRVLENNVIRPVGSKKDIETHCRVIAATNEDLDSLVDQGRFRNDLMYRLEVMRVELPPLRTMRDEIPLLAHRFIEEFAVEYERAITGISEDALDVLTRYHWPGNIRELRNVIAQACVAADTGDIGVQHLSPRFREQVRNAVQQADESDDPAQCAPDVAENVIEQINDADHLEGVFMPFGSSLDDVQPVFTIRTLEHCENNKTRAAKILGVSRKSLYERLKRWEYDG